MWVEACRGADILANKFGAMPSESSKILVLRIH